jgi:hypothetical protein
MENSVIAGNIFFFFLFFLLLSKMTCMDTPKFLPTYLLTYLFIILLSLSL